MKGEHLTLSLHFHLKYNITNISQENNKFTALLYPNKHCKMLN